MRLGGKGSKKSGEVRVCSATKKETMRVDQFFKERGKQERGGDEKGKIGPAWLKKRSTHRGKGGLSTQRRRNSGVCNSAEILWGGKHPCGRSGSWWQGRGKPSAQRKLINQ